MNYQIVLRFLFVLGLYTCSASAADDLQKPYIGLYGSASWGQDFVGEIKGFTNVVWVNEPVDFPYYADPLKAAHTIKILTEIAPAQSTSIQMKAVIDVQAIFFDAKLGLRKDYQNRWNSYTTRIFSFGSGHLAENILAFFPLDEAYANGSSFGISPLQMRQQLETVATTIKATWFSKFKKDIPIALSYTPSTVGAQFPIPNGFDWVGMDCYDAWENCNGKPLTSYFDFLKSQMNSNQRLILFPEAMSGPPTRLSESDLTARLRRYLEMAQKDPKVVAVFPFIWQTSPVHGWTGARDLPNFKKSLVELSTRFLNRIPILAASYGLAPTILNSGIGCDDNQCIWIIVKDLELDFRVDIRKTSNTGYGIDWRYNQDRIDSVSLNPDGTYLLRFRVTESAAITELQTSGLQMWVVNPGSGTFSSPALVSIAPVFDTVAPVISTFTLPKTSSTLSISTTIIATDNVGVTAYCVSAGNTSASCSWFPNIASFPVPGPGQYTVYAWAKDAAGNISESKSSTVIVGDNVAPVISEFTLPKTTTTLSIATTIIASDNVAVTGYCISADATPASCSWFPNIASFPVPGPGRYTVYAWAKDAAGNISEGKSGTVSMVAP